MEFKKLFSFFPVSVIASLFNLLLALIVVSQFGLFLWGSFLFIFLWLNLCSVIASFGVKDILLRKFELNPADSVENFQSAVISRMPLAILMSVVMLALPFGIIHGVWMSVWLIARTINCCYEPVSISQNKTSRLIIAEIICNTIIIILLFSRNVTISKFDLLQYFAIAEFVKTLLLIMLFRRAFPFPFSLRFDFPQLSESLPALLVSLTTFAYSGADQLIATFFLTAGNIAIYYLLISFLFLARNVTEIFSNFRLEKMYSFSEDSISRISLKILTAGGILSPIYLFICSWLLFTFCGINTDIYFLISGFFFIISICFYSPFLISLNKMKEDINLFRLNFITVLVICIGLPVIFNYYGIAGAFIFAGSVQLMQAISVRMLAKKVF